MTRPEQLGGGPRLRRGRPVATVGPAYGSTGRDLKEVMKRNRPDSAWAGELRDLREAIGSETDPWRRTHLTRGPATRRP